jgi:hypothetical protein
VGFGPHIVRDDDIVAVLFGSDVPYILRPVGSHYQLVGKAYIHGIMEGEIAQEEIRSMAETAINCSRLVLTYSYADIQEFEILW